MGVLSPGKGAVVLAENCGNSSRILSHRLKFVHDQMAGIFLIGLVDLLFGQAAQAGNFSVNIVRMGGSVAGNAPAGLRPAGRIGRMGMNDSSDFRECLIKLHMGRGIGGGVVFSFHLVSVQVNDHHIIRGKLIVVHAAGLDGKQPALPVDLAYISPGKGHKPVFGQKHVGFIDSFFQLF